MNPQEATLAVKAGQKMQIYSLALQRMTKETTLQEEVTFWKWISATVIVLVSAKAVYHWSMDGSAKPEKMFERHADMAGAQIINYCADSSGQWLCLVGISQKEGRIVGALQLYSVEKKISQSIEGHACAFSTFTFQGATKPSIVFTFAVRTATAAKVYILEVAKGEGSNFSKKAVDLFFPADSAADFPVGMQVSDKFGIIYVITKFGFLHMYDIETGQVVFRNRVSQDSIFLTAKHKERDGILCVNRKGQVLLTTVDEENIVPFLINLPNAPHAVQVAIALASRANLKGADGLFVDQFQKLFRAGQYKEAAKVAASSPGVSLRNKGKRNNLLFFFK